MSNPNLLCTENLIVTEILQSQGSTKFAFNPAQCHQRLSIDGNVRIDGALTLGTKYRFQNIEEKTPSNGININSLNSVIELTELPIVTFNDPNCNTIWGFEALENDTKIDTGNSVFGYQAGKFDEEPLNQSLFGKKANLAANASGGNNLCYFGCEVAGDPSIDYNHDETVSVGSEASKWHHYHGLDYILGYRAAAGDGFLYPCTFDQYGVGARAFELSEYVYDCYAFGAESKQLALCDFSAIAFGYRSQNFLSSDYNGYWCSAFGSRSQEVYRGEYWTTSYGAHSMINYDYGSFNVVFGGKAAARIYTGDENVLVGFECGGLQEMVEGNIDVAYHTAVGTQALYQPNNITNSDDSNTVVGNRGMYSLTTGIRNSAFGFEVMHNATTSSYNTVVGYSAMYSNVAGSNNTILGHNAMNSAGVGNNNVIIGHNAYSVGSGLNSCVLVGQNVANNAFPGGNCVLIGKDANVNAISGFGAVAIGANATAASDCVAVGYGASCTGPNSVVLGKNADDNSFQRCVVLGPNSTPNGNDQIVFPTGFVLANSATNDGGGAPVPAQVAGYINLKIGNIIRKVPLYPMP